MKIFDLESTVNVTIWSIILGFIINLIVFYLTFQDGVMSCGKICPLVPFYGQGKVGGYPFHVRTYYPYSEGSFLSVIKDSLFKEEFIFDLLFWIFAVLIVLATVSYLASRNKKLAA